MAFPDSTAGSTTTDSSVTVAIVILTINQKDKTTRCLASFGEVRGVTFRIVLWDNGSTDGTADEVRRAFPDVVVLRHPTNVGVATGRNLAAKHAIEAFAPSYLLFVDNDTTADPGLLAGLVRPLGKNPRVAQTTGKIRVYDEPTRLYGAGGCGLHFWIGNTKHVGHGEIDRGQYDAPHECVPSGGCMMVRTDVFQDLNGFDTAFDPYGPEDLDFGLRAIAAGYHGLYVPEAVIYHDPTPGRSFEGGQYSETFARHRSKHWFEFMRRHASRAQKLGFYFVGAPYLMTRLMVREAKKGNMVSAVKGLFRGLVSFWKS